MLKNYIYSKSNLNLPETNELISNIRFNFLHSMVLFVDIIAWPLASKMLTIDNQ